MRKIKSVSTYFWEWAQVCLGQLWLHRFLKKKMVDYWNINYFIIVGLTDHFTADVLNF